ncbi:hypothetical protein OG921_12790 [Aldersonia sp. NBC_00410]|uniref:hypothetical protein n=1 Tax=Aldersonia sp. NBC_00410 TaxID=2975954 RepID=UPI002255151B|nr:hypothetical protein [Aldersonia sp. NBC_00410]MCX5044046.1 hypothetical protein [Aldersonia sp. NBC_00410]
MNLVDRCGPTVAALIGGVLAAFALRESEVLDHTIAAKDGLSGVLVTPQWSGTVAAVVAVAVLAVLLRLRSGIGAAATALMGAAAIGLPAVVAVSTEPGLTLNAVGAGLILGAAAYPTAGRRAPLIALALGVLAATTFFAGARLWRVPAQRWSVALPGDPFYVPATVPLPILAVAVIVLGGVALTTRPDERAAEVRPAIVGGALPVVFLLLYTVLGTTESGPVSWTVAVGIAVAATLAGAWLLPAPGGRVLLVGLAAAAATVGQVHYASGAWWWVLAGLIALVAGVTLGRRYPMSTVGMVLLVLVTATGLLPDSGIFDLLTITAYTLVLPGALGLSVASVLSTTPPDAPVVVSAAMLPLTMTFFAVSAPLAVNDYGWSNGYRSSESGPAVAVDSPLPLGVVVATITATLATLAFARRSDPDRVGVLVQRGGR